MATPLTVVIFGASGDLTSRKLIPALFNLAQKNRLPTEVQVLGVVRQLRRLQTLGSPGDQL